MIKDLVLDFLFPKHCVSCDTFGAYLCPACKSHIKYFDFSVCPICDRPSANGRTHEVCETPLGLDGFLTFTLYADPISELTKSIKYAFISDAAQEEYSIIKNHWPPYAPPFDLLIPIPLHPHKLHIRGFNQAELLARKIGQHTLTKINTRALIKIRETSPQAHLKREERITNLQQGFVCLYPSDVANKTLGLVDDVATTRTTLKLACEVLKKAGAKEVWAITFAHSFP